MIYGMHTEMLILLGLFGAYILWQVWRVPKRGTRTPFQEDLLARTQQQSEHVVRQTKALERIAAALEKYGEGK